MSNSNFNITKVTVDPVSQEISSLEINGKPIETGGGNLQTIVYDSQYPLDVSALFPPSSVEPGEVCIEPDRELGYDGIEKVTIMEDGLTGYPDYEQVAIAKFTAEDEEPYTSWFAFKADSSGEALHLAEYIITDSSAKVWKKENDTDGGGFGSPITSYSGLTIGSSYVSITVGGVLYTSENLDDFLFTYLPKTN